ncbi:glycoside hydrolase family 2 protein [Cohnella sp. AR92]|uniref:glycoside hydrolase family 2 protein n=1 Tax=Cohnella sp. AR92 TaxID=648716 RepID=UPI00192E155C|nr:sugar-binding domain-containing protein [Cohnella sp. AR92]
MTAIGQKEREWRMAGEGLRTRWSADVDPEAVLPEYPRPQMVRDEWMNLNGLWEYAVRPLEAEEAADKDYDGTILVPFPIESALSGVGRPMRPEERLCYRRSFELPAEWEGRSVILNLGAVDWKTEVRVNGQVVGEHSGGYCPFRFDITRHIRFAEQNVIAIIVWDPTDAYGQERGKQTLQPKGLFYTAVSGIWQTVWLEPVSERHVRSFRLTPDIDAGELTIELDMGEASGLLTVEAVAMEDGKEVASALGEASSPIKLRIPEAKLWSPATPFLYGLEIRLLGENGVVLDRIGSYFGMRSFTIEADGGGRKRLCLNHEPLFQHGLLDQGYWPDGLYTAPTDEALAYDPQMAKAMGFNMIRKHIKVEPARWYYHCDRLGLIVWQDMPNGGAGWNHLHHLILPNLFGSARIDDRSERTLRALGRADPANREQYRKELKEMIDALYNSPCIGMWVPFNEAWGQFHAAETAAWVESCDPTRPVDHASGWHDQGYGDLKSVHTYFRKLRKPRDKGSRERVYVLSEYGGYGLPLPGHAWREGKSFGYRKYKSAEQLYEKYRSLIEDQLKPLIPQGLSAAVYTQLTDVETEANGLMTYDREVVKIDPARLRELHRFIESRETRACEEERATDGG